MRDNADRLSDTGQQVGAAWAELTSPASGADRVHCQGSRTSAACLAWLAPLAAVIAGETVSTDTGSEFFTHRASTLFRSERDPNGATVFGRGASRQVRSRRKKASQATPAGTAAGEEELWHLIDGR